MANVNIQFPFNSPAVAIRETDLSQNTVVNNGVNVPVYGFSPQGPTDEPTYISTLSEYEEIFGLPETAAEKYSYNAVKQLSQAGASILYNRMPYGSGAGLGYAQDYNALVFPVIGVSAVEVSPCDYYRNVDENNCRVNFPWLYDAHFVLSSVCVGTSNLNCPLNSTDEPAGALVIQDHPVPYNSVWTGFKFVVDSDTSPENLRVFQLRPTVSDYTTTYSVVTSINLSGIFANSDEDQSNLSNDAKRLIVDLTSSPYASPYNVTAGLLSGQTIYGIPVSASDVFATYSSSGAGVLKYFNASSDVAGSYVTNLTTLSSLSAGFTFSVTTTAVEATTQDYLIQFCTVPVEAGLSCQTITGLGLEVPEKDKYNFYPLLGDAQLNDANFYVLGEPISQNLNATEYQLLLNSQFNWKCGAYENVDASLDVVNNNVRAGLIVINEQKSAQLEDFTGYYLAVNDNLNVNPATDFDSITGVAGYFQQVCPGVSGEWIQVPDERRNFNVSGIFNGTPGSISEIVENSAGVDFGKPLYNDSLIVSLFKLRPSRLTETINKLDSVLVEKYVGSLNATRKVNDNYGGPPRSFYIEPTVNDQSNRLKVIVNPYLSENNCWNDSTGTPQKTVRMFREKTAAVFDNFDAQSALKGYGDSLFGVGSYTGFCRDALYDLCQKKDIGNLPAKLERAMRNTENPLEFPIDITVDAGLSTIWATREAVKADHCITDTSICYNYDDTYFVNTDTLSPYDGTTMQSDIQDGWEVITNIFDSFARFNRKAAGGVGHMHIVDPLRQIFVNGKDYKVVQRQKQYALDPATNQPTEKYANFSRNIWAYLRNLYSGINSSYSTTFGNWIKDYDSNTDSYCWFGPSAHVAALIASNQSNNYPWTPFFGINKGVLSNVLDLAINPNLRERELLAKIGVNPIVRFPEGNVIWNSLTLLKEDSALRENYIRLGLLWLAGSVQATLRAFIGEPNTILTRTRVKNSLRPILEYMKANAGLTDYLLVCDERNNSAESVDKGILNVSIYVKPVRAIKFINVDLVVTRTGVDFNELI